MRLLALSDLHVDHTANRQALEGLEAHPEDWLLVGGDLAETLDRTRHALDVFVDRFAKVFWVPGNHDLWTLRKGEESEMVRGVAKYDALVSLCRERGVVTPEDPYERWPGEGPPTLIAPLFILYDYSFGPDGLSPSEAKAWAAEDGIVCADEMVLHPDPYASKEAWCEARLAATIPRLEKAAAAGELVLLNHFPLRRDTIFIPRVPRFVPWCGTRATEDWHQRYRARAVVTGHLHVPRTRSIDGVPFHDVSVGYPRDWDVSAGLARRLRRIL